MVFNATYTNKETKELINDLIGRPFSFFRSLRMGGIGSKRMIVEEASNNLSHLLNKVSDINYGNIELRPNGILLRINKGLENFTWAIPYRQLVIYKTNGLSIHAQGKYIRFTNNKTFKENKNFFKKIMLLKIKSQERFIINAYKKFT